MPRDGSGVYSKAAGTTASPNTTIESAKFNATIDDLVNDANAARPITAGGTGAISATAARAALQVLSYDVAQSLTEAQKGRVRANIDAGYLGGFRNKIINGDFDFWQRGIGPLSAGYTADRWLLSSSGGTFTATRTEFPPGGAPIPARYGMFLTATAAIGPTVQHRIESVRTLTDKTVTLTFYVRSVSGSKIINRAFLRQYFGTGGSPSASVDTAAQTFTYTTDTKVSLTFAVPSISGKTIGTNNDDSLILVLGNTGTITGVEVLYHVSVVEGDATAEDDPFTPRHLQQEEALCQRYCEKVAGVAWNTISTYTPTYPYKVRKRATPTFSTITVNSGSGADVAGLVDPTLGAVQSANNSVITGITFLATSEL